MSTLSNSAPEVDVVKEAPTDFPKPPSAGKHVAVLDLLRLIAALAVVFYHYVSTGKNHAGYFLPSVDPITQYGYLGVQLFFIISGFVIFMSARKSSGRTFLWHRFIRLAPAYYAAVLLTFLLCWLMPLPKYHAGLKELIFNIVPVNFLPGISRFSHITYIDGSYWTLALEIQFYALAYFTIARQSQESSTRTILNWTWISLAIHALQLAIHNNAAQFLLSVICLGGYDCYFIAGCLFYILYSGRRIDPKIAVALFLSFFIALQQTVSQMRGDASSVRLSNLFAPVLNNGTHISPTVGYLVVGSFFALFSAISLGWDIKIDRKLGGIIGGSTYPLYLLHQHIGFNLISVLQPFFGLAVVLPVAAIVLAFSVGFNRLYELPVQRYLKKALSV